MAIERELARLRKKQAARVMPLIGQLLDAWEEVPNDFKAEIEEHAEALAVCLDEILEAVEGDE